MKAANNVDVTSNRIGLIGTMPQKSNVWGDNLRVSLLGSAYFKVSGFGGSLLRSLLHTHAPPHVVIKKRRAVNECNPGCWRTS